MTPARALSLPLASCLVFSGLTIAEWEQLSLPHYSGMTASIPRCAGALPVTIVARNRSDLADGAAIRKVMAWAQLVAQTECPQASTIELSAKVDNRKIYIGLAYKAQGWVLVEPKADNNPAATARVQPKAPGPFSQLSMGEYLDAIYNSDIDTVRQLDDAYLGQQTRQLEAGFASYGPFGKMLTQAMQLGSATLVTTAIRTYGASYDYAYGKCLREDAVVFVATESDRDTGIPISSRSYRMNRDIGGAFEEVYSASPVDEFVEPLASVTKGVRQIMQTYACNDPVTRQFERGLLDMYARRSADR